MNGEATHLCWIILVSRERMCMVGLRGVGAEMKIGRSGGCWGIGLELGDIGFIDIGIQRWIGGSPAVADSDNSCK